ncbi:hypothetical protein AYM40_03605 [Paraburkholderia phytofirmans OLGA172]|uniref:DUF2844 domain-containing protein n=1 Tax=Paraburkholderia phytofirmans OLGA172 TaxID=1417228 RepID=A0A160FHK5_9BURK|nr:DUF2844 domain-containing protein [Paraburkholderia phytofirmans]ANB71555.1 hypothetical protein AYM40_03605 [Paraburkholderia phytofirmans OLGA172]
MKFVKFVLAVSALLPHASYAALGGAPGAGSAPKSLLQSAASNASSTSTATYSVRESYDTDGVRIREYVLPTNVVFAVTWQGPVRPDMVVLLGSYFPNAVSAGAGRARGTGPLIERNGDFQIESAGRAGNFFGKAVLPRLVPANVRADDLQ